MNLCKWQLTADGFLHCPECNQPDPKKKYGSDPARWPKRNCKNSEPPKPPREVILDYLRLHPGSTIGEIVASCSGCKDRLAETLRGLVAEGLVIERLERRENLDWPVYFVVNHNEE